MEKGGLVLIIDDDLDFCALVAILVNGEGLVADCAHTLEEAIYKLNRQHPGLILLDNNLPDGKGIDFFVQHKSLFGNARVLMITADPSDTLRRFALDQGIAMFFSKPLMLRVIRDIIKQPVG